tara:strand:+ start:40406 stop:41458 length:1053 start_codon:yes stop_codon:yes gene_type:complete
MWNDIVRTSQDWAPALIAAAISIIVTTGISRALRKRHEQIPNSHLGVVGPLTTATLIGTGLVVTILALPIGDAAHGQLLGLLGLLVTGAIALSSTTILGNALAGIMLRAIRSFRPGDYLRVGEHVGRVSELGILHTEIQTEDRDLTTLPNLYLVTKPVTVLRSGTVVSATVSLGYEVSRVQVEKQLIEAAKTAGLVDPFVEVIELGDFSISYRAAGFLTEIKHIITTRSNLRKAVLDSLHGAQIEIVSPTFMNQRPLTKDDRFVPPEVRIRATPIEQAPESRIFDKADAAEAKEKMQGELLTQQQVIANLQAQIAASGFEAERSQLDEQLHREQKRLETLKALIAEADSP